jgi:predicted dehydrogenase
MTNVPQLPNALHYEWTMKALRAGKHVLNEKPIADTADEAAAMFDYAASKGLVLLDAYHYRFHPALLRVKEIVDSEEIGKLTSVGGKFDYWQRNDQRWGHSICV